MVGTGVAVVFFGASVLSAAGPVGADQVSSTRDQIQAAQAAVVSGAGQIRALTAAFEQANLKATTLAQQVAADQVQLGRLQARAASSEATLRHEAVASYMDGNGGTQPGVPVASAPDTDPSVGVEYAQVAAGQLTDALDQYRTDRRVLDSAQTALAAEQRSTTQAAAAVDQARQAALTEAATEQAQLNQLQGHLAELLAAQAAQAQAQAAEAAAARQRALAAQPATQGGPVNNGLVSLVNSVVGSSGQTTATRTPSPPATTSTSATPVGTTPRPTVPVTTAAPTTTTTVPAPAPTPTPPPTTTGGGAGGVWLQLRMCESSDNYQENSGNGYYGAYQFSQATWTGLGYPGRPDQEPPAMQDQAAMQLQARSGWGQWPACAAALGLT